jgi:hypothetical protein
VYTGQQILNLVKLQRKLLAKRLDPPAATESVTERSCKDNPERHSGDLRSMHIYEFY